jgi:hypothetical protein
MHVYRLETRDQDKEFLSGARVSCRAVTEANEAAVKSGDFILVQLSNGKKYKGKVVAFKSFQVDKYWAGDLVITKA